MGLLAAFWLTYFLIQPPTIGLSTFLKHIEEKQVTKVEVYNDLSDLGIRAEMNGTIYFIKAPYGAIDTNGTKEGLNIVQALKRAGIEITFVSSTRAILGVVMGILFPLFFFFMIIFMVINQAKDSSTAWMTIFRDIKTTFKDVAGAEEAKAELKEVLDFMKGEIDYSATGARTPRGVLLSGPPGTGKTLLAKALAGEAGVSFIAVAGSDFQSMWYGGSQRRVRALFKYARENQPCIIFIDEFDAIASKRSEESGIVAKESNGTLNQLLVQMDGFHRNDGIMVLAATNLVNNLDPAVRRAGRMDRSVEVGLPDQAGRGAILKVHVGVRTLDADVNLETVARGTPGFSGADLENVVNEAAIFAIRRKSATLSGQDFEDAKNKIIMGLERRSLVLTDEERELTAYHEAGHALAGCLTEHSDPVHRATIVPHGRALGMVVSLPTRDRVSVSLAKLRDDLVVTMAGRAAELVIFGPDMITSGAESDIEYATLCATSMVTRWGFSEKIGMVRVPESHAANDDVVKAEIRTIVGRAFDDAVEMVKANRAQLEAIAQALLKKEYLSGDEIRVLALRPANDDKALENAAA